MKIYEILNEVPVADFDVIEPKKGPMTIKPKDLQTVKQPEFQKVIKKKLADIDFDIYIYVIAVPDGITQINYKFYRQALNPSYYVQTNYNELKKMYDKTIADKIKITPNGATIIFNTVGKEFKLTKWSFIHDLIHALTLADTKGTKLFDRVEKLIENIYTKARKKYSPEHWEKGHKMSDYRFLGLIGTTGAARSGALLKRPEEFSTELLTQWIYSKKIEFDWSKISKSEELDRFFEKEFDKIIPKIENIFYQILENAKGKAFITSG